MCLASDRNSVLAPKESVNTNHTNVTVFAFKPLPISVFDLAAQFLCKNKLCCYFTECSVLKYSSLAVIYPGRIYLQ